MFKVTPCGTKHALHQRRKQQYDYKITQWKTVQLLVEKLMSLEYLANIILLQHVSVTTLRETLLGLQSTILIGVLIQEAALQHKVNCHLIHNIDRLVGTLLGNKKAVTWEIASRSVKPQFCLIVVRREEKCMLIKWYQTHFGNSKHKNICWE